MFYRSFVKVEKKHIKIPLKMPLNSIFKILHKKKNKIHKKLLIPQFHSSNQFKKVQAWQLWTQQLFYVIHFFFNVTPSWNLQSTLLKNAASLKIKLLDPWVSKYHKLSKLTLNTQLFSCVLYFPSFCSKCFGWCWRDARLLLKCFWCQVHADDRQQSKPGSA